MNDWDVWRALAFLCGMYVTMFIAGLGLMMGAWAGVITGALAFGPINIGRGATRIIVTDGSEPQEERHK